MNNLENNKSAISLDRIWKNIVIVHNRYVWPIYSLIYELRPLHYWAMGNIAQIKKGQNVLEVGSGYPLYKIYSSKVGKDGVFIALDIDPVIQERAQKIGYWFDKFNSKEKSSAKTIVSDAIQLPFSDGFFDTLIASNFAGRKEYINEAFRVLKPGGKLLATYTEFLMYPEVSIDQAKTAKQFGFIDVKVKPSMPSSIIPGHIWNYYVEATKPFNSN